MRNVRIVLFGILPFVIFTVFNSLMSIFYMDGPEFVRLISLVFSVILAMIIGLQFFMKDSLYFPSAVFTAVVSITVLLNVVPAAQYIIVLNENVPVKIVIANPQFFLYGSLFLMASMPQLLGKNPFTFYFAKQGVPEKFWTTGLFRTVNVYISNFWALLFALSFAAQLIPDIIFQIAVPVVIQLFIGLPVTRMLQPFLIGKLSHVGRNESKDFIKTAYDAVTGMPYVFNRKAADGRNLVFQFVISGDEQFEGYLEIQNGQCVYHDGLHSHPTLTVKSSADVYLKIAKEELNGQDAFLKGLYVLEGDLSSALLLSSIFQSGSSDSSEVQKKIFKDENAGKQIHFTRKYSRIKPGSIKKVTAIAGSPRQPGISKTDILTQAFLQGCVNGGAEVETVYLSKKNINHCTGCYTCWTKTPGVCIFKDDAAEIMKLENESDLIVYASPLYHYGMISILKKYIERTLPRVKPYLIDRGDGQSSHPVRTGYKEDNFAVIIGVCGFPEVSHFGAFSANFHYLANAGGDHGLNIVAELYRPYSETLNNPFYKTENERVLGAAMKGGEQVVRDGFIDQEIMDMISNVNLDIPAEKETANSVWDICIEEKITLAQFQESLIKGKGV